MASKYTVGQVVTFRYAPDYTGVGWLVAPFLGSVTSLRLDGKIVAVLPRGKLRVDLTSGDSLVINSADVIAVKENA